MTGNLPATLNDVQREFIAAANRLGSTSPSGARPLADWPPIGAGDLDELVQRGLVREGAARTYYTFARSRTHAEQAPARHAMPGGRSRRFKPLIAVLLVLLVVLLLPIVLLQLAGP